jgi:hypothetical protein
MLLEFSSVFAYSWMFEIRSFVSRDGWVPCQPSNIGILNCKRLTSLTLDVKHLTALEILVINKCKKLCLTGGEDNQDLKLEPSKIGD